MAIDPKTGQELDAFNTPQVTTNGGPQVNLNKINEYREALGTGAPLTHTTNPQNPTPSSVSNTSGGFSNLQEVGTTQNADGTSTSSMEGRVNTPTPPVSNVQTALTGVTTAETDAQKRADEQLKIAQKTSDENKALALKQEEDRVARETEYAKQKTENEKANLVAQQGYEAQYQLELQKRQQQQTDIMKPLLESEANADKAALTEMKLKQDNAEKKAQVDMDNARQTAALNLNRMGLVFSTAGVNTMLQISNQGTMKLAELSSSNASSQANLAVEIEKNKVSHANTMNKIINDSVDGVLNSKKRVSELIVNTNNNILLTEKQKNDNIDKAVSDYRKEKQAQEDDMYQKVQAASNATVARAKVIADTAQKQQDVGRNDLTIMLQTGVLSKMSPSQILQLEQSAGLPAGSASYMMKDSVVKSIAASLTGLPGFSIAQIPSDVLGNMTTEIVQMTKMGIPMNQATTQVMEKYLKDNQKYQDAVEMSSAGSKIAVAKAGVDLKNAQTVLTEKKAITEEEKAITQKQTTKLTSAKIDTEKTKQAKNMRIPVGKASAKDGKVGGYIVNDFKMYKTSDINNPNANLSTTAFPDVELVDQEGLIHLVDGSVMNNAGGWVSKGTTVSKMSFDSLGQPVTTVDKGEFTISETTGKLSASDIKANAFKSVAEQMAEKLRLKNNK